MAKISIYPKESELDIDVIENLVENFGQNMGIDMSDKIIEIRLVDDMEMQKLNFSYRHKDATTDVLSFPQTQISSPWQIFGTIVVSPKEAKRRSEKIEQLIKHGLLHLAGLDHETNLQDWKEAAQKIGHSM